MPDLLGRHPGDFDRERRQRGLLATAAVGAADAVPAIPLTWLLSLLTAMPFV